MSLGLNVDGVVLLSSSGRLFENTDVVEIRESNEPPCVVVVVLVFDVERRSSRLVEQVMSSRFPRFNERIPKGSEVRDVEHSPRVDVPDFTWADSPFRPTEPMLSNGYPCPRSDLPD